MPFDFSGLVPAVEQVIGPDGKKYELREASPKAVAQWRDRQISSATFDGEGEFVRVGPIASTEPYLVSLCLFELNGDGKPLSYDDKNYPICVDESIVLSWPYRIVNPLYDWIVSHSNLNQKKGKGQAKN